MITFRPDLRHSRAETPLTEGSLITNYMPKPILTSGARASWLAIAFAIGAGFTSQAIAQTTRDGPVTTAVDSDETTVALEDIVVTAEKRSTSLQRTPIAVTAISGEKLRDQQVRDLRDIQANVPNFTMGDSQGRPQISIRGVGSSTFSVAVEGQVAVNLNEVYIASALSHQTGLFDVSSLEVLRGPQGTLYGRNATAGAVNITTTRPTDELSGFLDTTIGNYGQIRVEGAIGGALDDSGKLLVRVAGLRDTHNGYGRNLVTGSDVDDLDAYGVRGTVVFKPTDNFQATVIGEYYNQDDQSGQYHYFGAAGLSGVPGATGVGPLIFLSNGFVPTDKRDIAFPFDLPHTLSSLALTGILDWKSSGPVSVKLISGYRDQESTSAGTIDGGSVANTRSFGESDQYQLSQEVQVLYDTDRLRATAGAYYFYEDFDLQNVFTFSSLLMSRLGVKASTPFTRFLTQDGFFNTEAYAGFGQATFDVTPELSITAGIRYSRETKEFVNGFGVQPTTPFPSDAPKPPLVVAPDVTFSAWTPKFGIQYQLNSTLLYASYSKGFKSGGFSNGSANLIPFKPEKLTSYEVGVKTTFADGRIRANMAGFYYDYTDLQVTQVVGAALRTSNAATARVYGIEGEFNFLLSKQFQVNANAAWTHARYGKYCGSDGARPNIITPSTCAVNGVLPGATADFGGNALFNAPDWRGFVAAQYTHAIGRGDLIFRGELEYVSRIYFAPNNFDFLSQGPNAKVNLSVAYKPDERWTIKAFVRNLGDKTTKTSSLVASPLVGSPILGSLAPPRLFGGQISYKF